MPPPDVEPAIVAARLTEWLLACGWPVERILRTPGPRIPGPGQDYGGRTPYVVLRSGTPNAPVWIAGDAVGLVVEIVPESTETVDRTLKRADYAVAGVAQCWIVDHDHTVIRYRLDEAGEYAEIGRTPLARVLDSDVASLGLR